MQAATRKVEALIFDMDGTMVDSMPWHAQGMGGVRPPPWASRSTCPTFLRRTTGRTGLRVRLRADGARGQRGRGAPRSPHEKESIYRALFGADFREVRGLRAPSPRPRSRAA